MCVCVCVCVCVLTCQDSDKTWHTCNSCGLRAHMKSIHVLQRALQQVRPSKGTHPHQDMPAWYDDITHSVHDSSRLTPLALHPHLYPRPPDILVAPSLPPVLAHSTLALRGRGQNRWRNGKKHVQKPCPKI